MNLLEQKIARLEEEIRVLKTLTGQFNPQVMYNKYLDSIITSLPTYADNAAALAGGLAVGNLYRTNSDPDTVCIVH